MSTKRDKRKRQKERAKKAQLDSIQDKTVNPSVRKIVFVISLILIITSIYLGLRDESINKSDLTEINITLSEEPKYEEFTLKQTTYRDIYIKSNEYSSKFNIGGMTYKSTNHIGIKKLSKNSEISIAVLKSKVNDLFSNNTIGIYSLDINNTNLIDLDKRNQLEKSDSYWFIVFTIFGLVMLPYAFIEKPKIGMDKAIYATAILGLVIILLIR
tara:strand:+ start:56 stop:694 length:639 start_codon:yes stop_codon:yes gene_type:complete